MTNIVLKVNNEDFQVEATPYHTLRDVLRDKLDFTDVKNGCGEGECGACTVLIDGKPVNSCLILAVQAQGKIITTIKGLGRDTKLNLLLEQFISHGAIQCGYCTPGMLVTARAFLERNPNPSEEEVRVAIAGNICRCTGYGQIVEAILAAVSEMGEIA